MSLSITHNRLTPNQWDAALLRSDAATAYQQHSAYAAAAMALGAQIERFAIMREGNNTPIALAHIHIKRVFRFYHIALSMRGPVWCSEVSDEEKFAAYRLLKSKTSNLISFPSTVLWMPESESHETMKAGKKKRVMTGYHTVMMDLTQSEEALLNAQDGKWRNRLRAAQKAELSVTHGGKAPPFSKYSWLLEKEIEQSARIGYAALTPALVPAFQAAAPSGKADNLHYIQATSPPLGTEPVGAMLFLLHGSSATYHIGWASEEGKSKNVHNLLLWEAMTALKKRGIRWLDLGGVSDDSAGLKRFKLGTGGDVRSLAGTYL